MNIQHIISTMTLEDKISLCTGGDFWHTKAMPQYGIPAIRGHRRVEGRPAHTASSEDFPPHPPAPQGRT